MEDVEGALPGDLSVIHKIDLLLKEKEKKAAMNGTTGDNGENQPTQSDTNQSPPHKKLRSANLKENLGRGNGANLPPKQHVIGQGRGRGLSKDPSSYINNNQQSDKEYASLLQAEENNQFEDANPNSKLVEKKVMWTTVPGKPTNNTSTTKTTIPVDLTQDFQAKNTGNVNDMRVSQDYAERKERWSLQRQTSYGKLIKK